MEYRVKFACEEDDSYVELWQLIGQEKYIARHTCGPKRWYYVSDPFGYRELDHPLKDDVTVIVCDPDGKELFRTCNADNSVSFNTPKQEAYEQWAKFAEKNQPSVCVENQSALFMAHWAGGTPVGNFNQWLLSFQDPELYEGAKDYAENWLWCRHEQIGTPEVLSEYTYLGERKTIDRIHFRHKICGVEWSEYYSGDYFIGHEFDGRKTGTMYAESEARKILTEAIRSHFPEARILSVVESGSYYGTDETYHRERHVRAEYAWERLCAADGSDGRGRKNLRRSFIDEVAVKEREHSHFFGSFNEIKLLYPDCKRDYDYL